MPHQVTADPHTRPPRRRSSRWRPSRTKRRAHSAIAGQPALRLDEIEPANGESLAPCQTARSGWARDFPQSSMKGGKPRPRRGNALVPD